MKELETTKTIGQIVTENYRAVDVFKKYNIDFCCGGKKTLESVCEKMSLPFHQILEELNNLEIADELPSQNFKKWNPAFLADYIVQTHHRYIQDSIPLLIELTQKIARVHGKNHPELIEIATIFHALAVELLEHLNKEEIILFPYIKKLSASLNDDNEMPQSHFGTVQNPIFQMEHEHDNAGELIHKIKNLSNDFTPPEGACNSYRIAFAKLKEFEQDLYQHIHLENNILFPKAIEIENSFAIA